MKKNRINIAVTGESDIIYEGLTNILYRYGDYISFYRTENIDELDILMIRVKINIAILNPGSIINRNRQFLKLRSKHKNTSWLALVYSFIDTKLINEFDDLIYITDTNDLIFKKIDRFHSSKTDKVRDDLSKREKDVLILLVRGLSNKEIAGELNISIHTVISHRKNIAEKTGIRSLPGLTIYAISNKIIPLNRE
ncbi:MAG: LuxR C-terminal-related transcriptional regulator [Bacteroidales bacterium]|jgi:DNA-binding CsgD family transcriptional regulator|nr:LuxR C-terminal-related transcriptional regulator [Bacteroidales bacterium]